MLLAGAFAIGLVTAQTIVLLRNVMPDETRPERMARVAALGEAAGT